MTRLLRRLWDRLSIYLPIMLMGLFALATLWLIRSTPMSVEAIAAKPLRHEADYFLKKFSIRTFDARGQLKSEVFGAEARHYPDTDTLEIEKVRARTISETGRQTIANANRAVSDAAGDEIQLLGNVHVVREPVPGRPGQPPPPLEFRSEFLHVFSDSENLKTHLPVTISQGADRFRGNSMSYDNTEEVLELKGQVRGILNPRKGP
jgi:lipopolysaccharide export system protein LptC